MKGMLCVSGLFGAPHVRLGVNFVAGAKDGLELRRPPVRNFRTTQPQHFGSYQNGAT